MSPWVTLIIVLAAVLLSIVIGQKLKVNLGIVAIGFAYIIGSFLLKFSVNDVVAGFPSSTVFLLLTTCLFYGFAIENGTMNALAAQMIYYAKNIPWALIPLLGLVTFCIAAMGAGPPVATMLVAPIAYAVALKSRISPLMTVIIVSNSAMAGGVQGWSLIGNMMRSIGENFLPGQDVFSMAIKSGLAFLIFALIIGVVCFFLMKGYRAQRIELETPVPLNKKQKQTLVLILVILVLVVVPALINLFAPNPVTSWMTRYLDIKMLAVLGAIIASILQLADGKAVLEKRVPWSVIVVLSGMIMLVSIALKAGAIAVVAEWVGTHMPASLVSAFMVFLGGFLSFFMGGGEAFAIVGTMMPTIASSTGITIAVMYVSYVVGSSCTSISPLSMGGSLIMSLCPDTQVRDKLFVQQIVFAIVELIVAVLLAMVGLFSIFG